MYESYSLPPNFLLFKTSPVIIVVLSYINTTLVSFGK